MKKITIIGFLTLLLATACSKDDNNSSDNGSLLLLEIDYVKNTFIGGKEYKYSSAAHATDTVPVKAFYISPCDHGSLTIRYEPARDIIFEGTVLWLHSGKVEIPAQMVPASSFEHSSSTARIQPDNSQFQVVYIDEHCVPSSFGPIWEPVSNLAKAKEYYNPNKKIGIFLYTPGIYAADEINKHKEEWRWFIIMHK